MYELTLFVLCLNGRKSKNFDLRPGPNPSWENLIDKQKKQQLASQVANNQGVYPEYDQHVLKPIATIR